MRAYDVSPDRMRSDAETIYSYKKWTDTLKAAEEYPLTHAGQQNPAYKELVGLSMLIKSGVCGNIVMQAFSSAASGKYGASEAALKLFELSCGYYGSRNTIYNDESLSEESSARLLAALVENTDEKVREVLTGDESGLVFMSPLAGNLHRTMSYDAHYASSLLGKKISLFAYDSNGSHSSGAVLKWVGLLGLLIVGALATRKFTKRLK